MISGTTPTHTFTVPFNVATIDELHIIYSQKGVVKVKKTKADCVLRGNKIEVTLSQRDTLSFIPSSVSLQLRVLRSGTVISSKVFTVPVEKCLENEVM